MFQKQNEILKLKTWKSKRITNNYILYLPPKSTKPCFAVCSSVLQAGIIQPLSECWQESLLSQLCEILKYNENAATVLSKLLVDIFTYFVIFKGENNGGICALVLSAHLHAEAERYPFIINFMHYFISWC